MAPKLYRNIDETRLDGQLIRERRYLYEFRRRALSYVPKIDPNDIWSWYFLVQHYGGPTRLLDWTTDPTIALFFALETRRDSSDNPVVITLEPTTLVNYAFKEIDSYAGLIGTNIVLYPGESPTEKWIDNISSSIVDIPSSPIPLLPPYSDPRISAQSSCFTLFGRRINGFYSDDKQIICPTCGQKVFGKVVIDGNSKDDLRQELSRIGVTIGKVYPEVLE